MPVTKPLRPSKFLILLSCGLFLGGFSAVIASYVVEPKAAKPQMKAGSLALGAFAGKAHRGLQARIATLDEITDDPTRDVRVRVRLQLQKEMDAGKAMKFRWELPNGVQIVSGDQSGQIASFEVGEIWEQFITVRGLTAVGENQNIKFVAEASMEGQNISIDAILSSQPMQKDLSRMQFDQRSTANSGLQQKLSGEDDTDKGRRPPKGIKF